MKFLRLALAFIVSVIVVTAILSLLLPARRTVTKSITINAPAKLIFDTLSKLKNFKQVAVWSQQDSTAVFTDSGNDGTVGAITSWKGHPMISGEGTIRIKELISPRKIVHEIEFIQPKNGKATSTFDLLETNRSTTTVAWTFEIPTPRPWNIFNMFYSMEKERGAEFEAGLGVLRKMVEGR